jgi:hypothetical protein
MNTLQVLLKRAGLDDEQDLEDQYGITVGKDGLVEPERITPKVARLIRDLPIALWHHTSSALEKKIRRQGLIVGKQTNYFNTQAGVYVSTIGGGQPVDLYSAVAVRKYGGEPIAIRVRRTLDQIVPDPDDADLAWARGRQFITDPVPPEDLTFDWVPWEVNPMRKLDGLTKHQRMVVEDFVRWVKLPGRKDLSLSAADLAEVLKHPRDYLDLSPMHLRMFRHKPSRPGMGRNTTPVARTLRGRANPPYACPARRMAAPEPISKQAFDRIVEKAGGLYKAGWWQDLTDDERADAAYYIWMNHPEHVEYVEIDETNGTVKIGYLSRSDKPRFKYIGGTVYMGQAYRSNMGDARAQVTIYGCNGVTYHGTYYYSRGLAQIKAAKGQFVRTLKGWTI